GVPFRLQQLLRQRGEVGRLPFLAGSQPLAQGLRGGPYLRRIVFEESLQVVRGQGLGSRGSLQRPDQGEARRRVARAAEGRGQQRHHQRPGLGKVFRQLGQLLPIERGGSQGPGRGHAQQRIGLLRQVGGKESKRFGSELLPAGDAVKGGDAQLRGQVGLPTQGRE